ncbi:MAG: nucleotide disphospho-sugar-binding domain-containing protein [Cyanobacteria bacterium P01_H01_bin.35]
MGHELKTRGHRVSLIGIPDIRAKAEIAELEFIQVGEKEFPTGSLKKIFSPMKKLKGVAAERYLNNQAIKEVALVLNETPALIQEAGVEALLVDQISAGSRIARFLNLPYITICNAMHTNREITIPPFNTLWQYNQAWWALLRNQLGYKMLDILWTPNPKTLAEYQQIFNKFNSSKLSNYSSLAILSQMLSEFDFPRQRLPQRFHYVGSIQNEALVSDIPFPWEKLTGEPLIYASMGTAANQYVDVFEKIATACEGLDIQLVMSLGGNLRPEDLPELPTNTIVVNYAPQLKLLQKASLTITHAGMNSTLESLVNGVPMVAIPVIYDQPGIASRIVWTGVGEAIALKSVNVSRLRKAITKVLTEDTYKQNANRLKEASKQAGGVTRAADIIEQAVATGEPVLSSLLKLTCRFIELIWYLFLKYKGFRKPVLKSLTNIRVQKTEKL